MGAARIWRSGARLLQRCAAAAEQQPSTSNAPAASTSRPLQQLSETQATSELKKPNCCILQCAGRIRGGLKKSPVSGFPHKTIGFRVDAPQVKTLFPIMDV
jgi:hypothetical protein